MAISGGGNCMDVVNAVKHARQAHATTIGLLGFDGGVLKDLVDICILVSNDSYEQVEDLHLMLGHLMCVCIRHTITADAYPLPENLVSESGRLRLNEEVVSAQGSIPRS